MTIVTVPNHKKMKKLEEAFDFGALDITDDPESTYSIEGEKELFPEIEEWLKKFNVKHYELEATGKGVVVDVNDHLWLPNFKLYSLPDIFRFRTVRGNCNFANNMFTDWRFFPTNIMGDCLANFNRITSFDGAPQIGGTMIAERQKVKTLYPLDHEHYVAYLDGENLNENVVFVESIGEYGKLTGISKDKKSCSVLLEADNKVINTLCENVNVVDGFKYIEALHAVSKD